MSIAKFPAQLAVGGTMHQNASIELYVDLPIGMPQTIELPLRSGGSTVDVGAGADAIDDGIVGMLLLERVLIVGPQVARYVVLNVVGYDCMPERMRKVGDKVLPPVLDQLVRLRNAGLYPSSDAGPRTLRDVCGDQGADWKDKLEQRARECKRLGIDVRIDALNPGDQMERRRCCSCQCKSGAAAVSHRAFCASGGDAANCWCRTASTISV